MIPLVRMDNWVSHVCMYEETRDELFGFITNGAVEYQQLHLSTAHYSSFSFSGSFVSSISILLFYPYIHSSF